MTGPVRIVVRGTPKPKGSFRVITRGRGGRPLPFPKVLKDTPEVQGWENAVALAGQLAMRDRAPFAALPLAGQVVFALRRPTGHYGKHGLRPSAPHAPLTKPDWDKLARSTFDALEGVVYDNDSRVSLMLAARIYVPLGVPEGAVIELAELDAGDAYYQGVAASTVELLRNA